MVSITELHSKKVDPVSRRLLTVNARAETIDWLEMQRLRRTMTQRAFWTTMSAWLLVTVASLLASFIAIQLAMDVKTMSSELGLTSDVHASFRWVVIPLVMVSIAALVIVGGITGWILGFIPGYRSTRSAIEWACTSDAVSRLLAAGCTYNEAFSAAAQVARIPAARDWLKRSATRVAQGASVLDKNSGARKDVAMLEALIGPTSREPAQQWRLASEHFVCVAENRLTMLLQAAPILSTLFSGVLLWITLNTTLGWFWIVIADWIRWL